MKYSLSLLGLITVEFSLTSCFTGIEGTKKITLSRQDRRETAPTHEETFLADIRPSAHTEWDKGKPFYVADDRASVMIDAVSIESGKPSLECGDELRFLEARDIRTPDGTTRTTIIFMRGNDEFRYMAREAPAGRSVVMSDDIPGLIDPEMIRAVADRLKGMRLWTLSTLWLDADGNRKEGLKYDPVTVTGVEKGNMIFPVKVKFRDDEGRSGSYLMNFGNTGKDSRSFSTLFSTDDPRTSYPGISDSTWQMICQAKVAPGMTKQECRLAKGNPTDVYDGHDHSKSMLLWVYPDATTLYFEDDILVRVKGY